MWSAAKSQWSAAKSQWLPLRSKFVSLIVVFFSHLALAIIPRIFPFLSLLAMLPVAGSSPSLLFRFSHLRSIYSPSARELHFATLFGGIIINIVAALVLVSAYALAGWLRRLLDLTASAPAMVVGHILFIWGVHMTVVRAANPNLINAVWNMECVLLLIGLYRISYGDPGIVPIETTYTVAQIDPSEDSPILSRVRHCYFCKRNVEGFDHHCPAFGNCIGQKNHHLFMVLVIGFVLTEATFTICSIQYIKVSSRATSLSFERYLTLQRNFPGNLVISTLLFSILQVFWQAPFLTWHIYCICCNIKTEEWVNWSKYPEFQLVSQPRQVARFVNPYNHGVLRNVREYLTW